MAPADPEAPSSVLDASALLAHLHEEPGASIVREAMASGAAISILNWAEVLSKLAERGEDPELVAAELRGADLIGGAISVEPICEVDAIEIACLRSPTRKLGLSMADRACIALAKRLQVPVVTADQAWVELPVMQTSVIVIR